VIANEIEKRGLKISVMGIPKTIDNDILFVEKTFGYETAYSVAVESIESAHTEAEGAFNGIGLVKLMGRDSGFITASAALADHNVNFVLVPEVPFELEGENGFLTHLLNRVQKRHHAVVCMAEGAGRHLVDSSKIVKDASGNDIYPDIGVILRDKIKMFFKDKKVDYSLKYIDPSYIIRSAAAIPSDSIYCSTLGQNAVHAAMAGKPAMIVGLWNSIFTHVPIEAIITGRKKVDPESQFWLHVIESTGQPFCMKNR
jgi:6-phosphofructokinase 1